MRIPCSCYSWYNITVQHAQRTRAVQLSEHGPSNKAAPEQGASVIPLLLKYFPATPYLPVRLNFIVTEACLYDVHIV